MKLLNTLEGISGAANPDTPKNGAHEAMAINVAYTEGFSVLLRLLSPITPHISDYLWRELGYGDDILKAPWPEPDEQALRQDVVEPLLGVGVGVQGNGAGRQRGLIAAFVGAHIAAKDRLGALAEQPVIEVLHQQLARALGRGQPEIEQIALADDNVKRFANPENTRKIVLVPGRLVNIVVS